MREGSIKQRVRSTCFPLFWGTELGELVRYYYCSHPAPIEEGQKFDESGWCRLGKCWGFTTSQATSISDHSIGMYRRALVVVITLSCWYRRRSVNFPRHLLHLSPSSVFTNLETLTICIKISPISRTNTDTDMVVFRVLEVGRTKTT